jgi:methylmalonyl-CoA mutase
LRKTNSDLKSTFEITREMSEKITLFHRRHRTRYLSEIAESNRHYDETAVTQEQVAHYTYFKTGKRFQESTRYYKKAGIDDVCITNCN